MNITRFDPLKAKPAHEGTILADDVVPAGMHEPFEHAYGYLLNSRSMMGHSHPTDEIYIVMSGTGYVMVGGRNIAVKAGDIVAIPPNVYHTMFCTEKDEAPYKWAALWWPHMEGVEPFGEEIVVQRFDPKTAESGHNGTILAADVVPRQLKTPFGHAFGYLTAGQTMEAHRHHTHEMYMMLEGTGKMTIDDETCNVTAGDVIAIPPDALHELTAKSEELLMAALWWDAE